MDVDSLGVQEMWEYQKDGSESMTEKICRKCGTYQSKGLFCEECGTQLYPDIGATKWRIPSTITKCKKPKFNRWTGKEAKA